MSNNKNSLQKQKINSPCVYILLCSDGTLYTGWSNNFKKRLSAHNTGKGAKYTRGRLPVTAIYLEFLPDKVSATKREAAIKKLSAAKKRQLIASDKNQLFMVSST